MTPNMAQRTIRLPQADDDRLYALYLEQTAANRVSYNKWALARLMGELAQ